MKRWVLLDRDRKPRRLSSGRKPHSSAFEVVYPEPPTEINDPEYRVVQKPIHEWDVDVSAGTVAVTYNVTPYDVETEKQALEQRAVQLFRDVSNAGISIDLDGQSVEVATTHDARQELRELIDKLKSDGGVQKITTRSGRRIDADLDVAEALHDQVAEFISACRERESDLIDQIRSAETMAELNTIDINEGWPG